MSLPRAVQPFVDFASVLRAHGFSVAPDQTVGFIEAAGVLGPRDMNDIRASAIAMLAIPKEREAEFDALFSTFFEGQIIAAPVQSDTEDDEMRAQEDQAGTFEPLETEEEHEAGQQASHTEALSRRAFDPLSADQALARFSRLAPRTLPRRKVRRRQRAPQGDRFDMRRTLREAVRTEGDVMKLPKLARKTRHSA